MKTEKIFAVSYHNHGGYRIEIDAKAPIESIIKTVRIKAISRKDALKAAIHRLQEGGHINKETAALYLSNVTRLSKSVSLTC